MGDEAIASVSGNDMHVEVEDRLPCSRTGRVHEVETVGLERIADHPGDPNGCCHHPLSIADRDFPQVGRMVLRHHNDVSLGRWVDVHDGDHGVILVDALRRCGPGHYAAEGAGLVHVPKGTGVIPTSDRDLYEPRQ